MPCGFAPSNLHVNGQKSTPGNMLKMQGKQVLRSPWLAIRMFDFDSGVHN